MTMPDDNVIITMGMKIDYRPKNNNLKSKRDARARGGVRAEAGARGGVRAEARARGGVRAEAGAGGKPVFKDDGADIQFWS